MVEVDVLRTQGVPVKLMVVNRVWASCQRWQTLICPVFWNLCVLSYDYIYFLEENLFSKYL